MEVFQCRMCPSFLETYVEAVGHLRTRHGLSVRTGSRSLSSSSCHEKLEKVELKRVTVNITRINGESSEEDDEEDDIPQKAQPFQRKPRQSKHTVSKTKSGVEIKLDSLKASEIETLMNDLYRNKAPNSEPNSIDLLNYPRNKSNRRAAATAADQVFSKLGEEEEKDNSEEPPTIPIRKSARMEDKDYRPAGYHSGNEDFGDDFEIGTLPPKRRRRERKNDICYDKDKKKHKCNLCEKKFSNLVDLEKHEEFHEERLKNKAFNCPLCESRFAKKPSLQQHFILHLENNPYVCKLTGCGAKFGAYEHLQRHIKLHTGIRSYKCEVCSRDFARSDSLQKHIRNVHSTTSPKGRKRRMEMRKSYCKVKPISDLAPDTIMGSIPTPVIPKEELEEHRWEVESQHFTDHVVLEDSEIKEKDVLSTVEDNGRPHQKAESMSNNSSDLDGEEDQESESEIIPTRPVFTPKAEIRRSVRSIILNDPVYIKLLQDDPEGAASVLPATDGYARLNDKQEIFKCTECNWVGGSRSYFLQQHMKKRHNIDITLKPSSPETNTSGNDHDQTAVLNLLCGTCGYKSNSAANLSEHIKKEHETTKKFPCSYCSIRFDNPDKQKLHEKNFHLTEKKFTCAKCSLKFAYRHSLHQHERKVHDLERRMLKTFKCTICKSELASFLGLKRHMSGHSNSLRVTCKICNQSCATKHVLKRHIGYVHLNKPNPYNKRRDGKLRERLTQPPQPEDAVINGTTTTTTCTTSGSPTNTSEIDIESSNDLIIGF